jgi:hypothetical protein
MYARMYYRTPYIVLAPQQHMTEAHGFLRRSIGSHVHTGTHITWVYAIEPVPQLTTSPVIVDLQPLVLRDTFSGHTRAL